MSLKNKIKILTLTLFLLPFAVSSHTTNRTTYPVVFAHGMAGFDDILGFPYWAGNNFDPVYDPCDKFLEVDCNQYISDSQDSVTFAAQVQPFHNSEVRGYDLANQTEAYMVSKGYNRVSFVGHSQGGLDLRKAAKELKYRSIQGRASGYNKVRVAISISSPHRGSPVAQWVFSLGDGVTSVLAALTEFYGDTVNEPGNDAYEGLKQLIYEDIDGSGSGKGARKFNNSYDLSSIDHPASLITGQDDGNVNPALFLIAEAWMSIDGDGSCTTDANGDGDYDDCNNDGALGRGDGSPNDMDSDGLVGINSQQMGYRLYESNWGCGPWYAMYDCFKSDGTGFVSNMNRPNSTQQSSHSSVISQDHLDVIGVGPDMFDEDWFYHLVLDYIERND